MNKFLEPLLARYRQRGVLVDANLLLLYLVGEFDRRQITSFRRTRTFTVRDYLMLKTMVEACQAAGPR